MVTVCMIYLFPFLSSETTCVFSGLFLVDSMWLDLVPLFFHMVGPCLLFAFQIWPDNLYVLIGLFKSFIFKVLINISGIMCIFLFVFLIPQIFFYFLFFCLLCYIDIFCMSSYSFVFYYIIWIILLIYCNILQINVTLIS